MPSVLSTLRENFAFLPFQYHVKESKQGKVNSKLNSGQQIGLYLSEMKTAGSDVEKKRLEEKAFDISRRLFTSIQDPKKWFCNKRSDNYREKIKQIRAECSLSLENGENAREIYKKISSAFSKFLGNQLIKSGVEALGTPPCKFSIIALGSLGRAEMTPYSDFEYAILLEKKIKDTKYFRALSKYIQHQILFIGETPLRELNLQEKGSIDKGFSLDGYLGKMAPNWNPNLIKTPAELALFQEEEHFKKRRIFPGELRNFKRVYGSESLVTYYQNKINQILKVEDREKRALKLIEADGDRFGLSSGKIEESGRVFTPKYDLYRQLQLVIDGLSYYYGVSHPNLWSRIAILRKMNIFSNDQADDLTKCADRIMKLRLKIYLEKNRACEELKCTDFPLADRIAIYKTLIPLYTFVEHFVISKGLIAKTANASDRFECTEGFASAIVHQLSGDSLKAIDLFKTLKSSGLLEIEQWNRMGQCYSNLGKHNTAHKVFKIAFKKLESLKNSEESLLIKRWEIFLNANLSALYYSQSNYQMAHKTLEKASEICEESFGESHYGFTTWSNLSVIHNRKMDYDSSIKSIERALLIQKNYEERHLNTVLSYYNLGESYQKLGKWEKAREHFEKGLEMAAKIGGKFHPAYAHCLKGVALVEMDQPGGKMKLGITLHLQALIIYREVLGKTSDEAILQLCNCAVSYGIKKELAIAIDLFSVAEKIIQGKENKGYFYSSFYSQKGLCYLENKEYEKAINEYTKSLDHASLDMLPPYEKAMRLNNLARVTFESFLLERKLHSSIKSDLKDNLDEKEKKAKQHSSLRSELKAELIQAKKEFEEALKIYGDRDLPARSKTKKNLKNLMKHSKDWLI